jgi:tritrans,polycis-undecaprenyl-diphosphate synthase [geranylgeranyl-diphosphate specific]
MATKIDVVKMISDTAYQAYERKLLNEIRKYPIPKHIAIIMDGNRRFALHYGIEPTEGHVKGREKLEEVMDWCLELRVKILTVYAFSTENLKRDKHEVSALMKLFEQDFKRVGDDERVHKHKIRVRVIGQTKLLPKKVREAIKYAETRTKNYNKYLFNIAVAYGGREEIIHAIKEVARDVKNGKLNINEINEKLFAARLYTKNIPDPDLILRTSGEERISNFLLWQLAYSELYFTDVYWPGFRKIDFLRAVRSYQMRHRRIGR